MASEDRMIVPYVCECCGAPLNSKKRVCEFCKIEWDMVKRYEGPNIPDIKYEIQFGQALGTACSYPVIHLTTEYSSEQEHAQDCLWPEPTPFAEVWR